MSVALDGTFEALLFLSPEPVSNGGAGRGGRGRDRRSNRGARITQDQARERRTCLVLRELAGGWTLASHPRPEEAARRLLARPRTPHLTPAQAETLAIIAYWQPVSRPEIARIRGVNAESAAQTLLERGLVEESGRSQFGAVLYRTTDLFPAALRSQRTRAAFRRSALFDPSPELEEELRERLLRAGEAASPADQAVPTATAASLLSAPAAS